jgi:hypothetical protein
MEGLWQKEHHAPDCYQPTVDGVLGFDLLAYYANDSGRNEVQVREWSGQLDNPDGLACLNEHNLLKARIAKHISKSQTSLTILVAKLGKILNYCMSEKMKFWTNFPKCSSGCFLSEYICGIQENNL